jgi:hypothetical protein
MHLVGSDALGRPSAGHSYSWVGDYLRRLEGKEACEEYYAALARLTIYD